MRSRCNPASRGSACFHLIAREQAHHLDRNRPDVEVGRVYEWAPLSDDADAGHPGVACVDRLDLMLAAEVHPQGAQVGQPGIEPDLVGRPVEHPVHLASGAGEVEEQLEQDHAPRAGAHFMSLRCHQGAGEPVGEELAVGGRARLGAGELPPALVLVLGEPPLIAARQQNQEPVHEVSLVLRRDPERGGVGEQGPKGQLEVVRSGWKVRGRDDLRSALQRHLDTAGRDEIAEHALALAPERDPPHCVGQVAVEAGKEAEPVLGGKVLPAPRARARDRHAPRLATGDPTRLVHDHVEVAFGQLVGGAHAGDAPTKDDDLHAHLHCGRTRAGLLAGTALAGGVAARGAPTLPIREKESGLQCAFRHFAGPLGEVARVTAGNVIARPSAYAEITMFAA